VQLAGDPQPLLGQHPQLIVGPRAGLAPRRRGAELAGNLASAERDQRLSLAVLFGDGRSGLAARLHRYHQPAGRLSLVRFPAWYSLSLAGIIFFGLDGCIDLTSHAIWGFETGLEALNSPTHIGLFANDEVNHGRSPD
jgi:hypothetical protein